MANTTLAPPDAETAANRIPPHVWFVVSAVFHYLGPSFAVLLFERIEPLGVAWLRIASAAVVFAVWRRP
jgi:inner membrane transporter RhtA